MIATIRLEPETIYNRRAVFINEEHTHTIQEKELDRLLSLSSEGRWKTSPSAGGNIGRDLFRMLDGGGFLKSLLMETVRRKEILFLYIDAPLKLYALPYELLRYGNSFLALSRNPQIHIIRRVARSGRFQAVPDKRKTPPRILFMASAPEFQNSTAPHVFEEEEAWFQASTDGLPLEIEIEDSGGLDGLRRRFQSIAPGGYDVIHLSGRAGIDGKGGAVFLFEDEVGKPHKVTPAQLWEAVSGSPPRLLILSGFSPVRGVRTGAGAGGDGNESLAFQMVDLGIPWVIRGAFSLADRLSGEVIKMIYQRLAEGRPLIDAVGYARRETARQRRYYPWPLIRLFTDGSHPGPLVFQDSTAPPPPRRTFRTHDNGRLVIPRMGFVARRREIQEGVRILHGISDSEEASRFTLLIRGPAGIGKTVLAGNLIEHFSNVETIVIEGRLSGARFLDAIRRICFRRNLDQGLFIIESEMDFSRKVEKLFNEIFRHTPLMVLMDRFESNIIERDKQYVLTPAAKAVLSPLLHAIDFSEGSARLIITSRHPFDLQPENDSLPHRLSEIVLLPFVDADLAKLMKYLVHLPKSPHMGAYLRCAFGNPGLLRWLDRLASLETSPDTAALENVLSQGGEALIGEYIFDRIARLVGDDFRFFLHAASVFRLPVPAEAFEHIGDEKRLESGVSLELLEKRFWGKAPVYRMTPAARTYFWRRLETSLKPVFHRTALSWYQKRLRTAGEEEFLLEETLEAVHHAKGAGDTAGVIDYALSYCEHLHRHRLYQEAVSFLCEWIDELKNDAGRMETGDLLLTRLLYLTGLTKSATGEWKAAFECIKRGVLRERVRHRSSITDAKESLRESKSPWRAAIPVQRPVARCREALENALSVYGARHKQVAFRYHDLGALYLAAGDPENAARCLEKVVDIEIRTIGDNNRKSIRSYVALAAAYRAMGEVEKEIDALNRRLDMETYIYGDVHPFLAETLTLLGNVWERTGEIRRAVVLYKKALEMVQACFGHRHHRAAEAHRRLGRVYRAAGKLDEAVNQFESAVEILSMPEASVDPSKEINQGKKHHLTPTKKRRSS